MKFLDGIRVISFNHFMMGPLGMQILGDLGADVIAVEPMDGAFQRHWSQGNRYLSGDSLTFASSNRNKRSLALDLKSEGGKEVALRLIAGADVLSENFRPGVMDRLGLGYDHVKQINPDLIYAVATGYGPDGPYRDRPGQDLLVQAMSGIAAITGRQPDEARAVGASIVDHHGATLFAMGILAALMGRMRGGSGCRVDVSLLSAALDLQGECLVSFLNGERPASVRQPGASAGWSAPGGYGVFPARDGNIAISLATPAKLGEALEDTELGTIGESEPFTRSQEISDRVEVLCRRHSVEELIERFTDLGIWHTPVNDYAAVAEDPQVIHNRHLIETLTPTNQVPVRVLSHAVRYDGAAPAVRIPPQKLGAQTTEILREVGYSDVEIDAFIAARVVGAQPR